MTFGNVQPGQQELYVNPINSINAGFMIATGNPEAAFRLTYLPEIVLTQVDGTSTLTLCMKFPATLLKTNLHQNF